jgi:hypothetical protein
MIFSIRAILEPMVKSLQPRNSQALRRINDDYEDEAKNLINNLALSYGIVDAFIDGDSESTMSDLELTPHNAGLGNRLQIRTKSKWFTLAGLMFRTNWWRFRRQKFSSLDSSRYREVEKQGNLLSVLVQRSQLANQRKVS